MTPTPSAPVLRRAAERGPLLSRRLLLVVLSAGVVVVAWAFVLSQATGRMPSPATVWTRSTGFVADLLGAATDATPAFATASGWRWVGPLVLDTLAMSVLAMGIAGAGVLLSVAPASRILMTGELARRRTLGRLLLLLFRAGHAVLRAVPELIWAMLVVFLLRPGLIAGALALALHELGVLGRLGSDVVDDLEHAPLRSLRSAGAGDLQLLLYGALPQILPQLVTFLLYRWEIVIRATVVVGFVTGAGLGHELRLALSFRRWTEVALLLMSYVLLVWAVEALATLLRRLAR